MKKTLTIAAIAVPMLALGSLSTALANKPVSSSNLQQKVADIVAKNPKLDPTAVKYALKGYKYAGKHAKLNGSDYLTLVNFNKPDTAKRLNVINLKNDKVVFTAHVAQGSGSGEGTMAKRFSNGFDTHESSLGTFVTQNTYYGHHGRELHINGLEHGLNNNARARAVIIHSAWYVHAANTPQGHSWGCFAVSQKKAQKLIDLVKGGSVLFAYASPEQHDQNLV